MEAKEIEKCIEQFGTDIYRFCLKICMNKPDAEDLYQQTFLKALVSNWELNWEDNPKALFFSLAHNLWKSKVRKSFRRSSIAPCSSLDDGSENFINSEETIEENFLKKELLTEINITIEQLPDKIRVPITLYYLFEFPIEQIAKTIKKPTGTVKSRLFKGRKIIKNRLEEIGYDR